MLTITQYNIPVEKLQQAVSASKNFDYRCTLNRPTGRFFYDAWQIQDQYKDTVWNTILSSLPFGIGEARIMQLEPAKCYQAHADIDDRYHLNLTGENCYLIDLDNNRLNLLVPDGHWYLMDAGRQHTATNFGRYTRTQLVVRKLLQDTKLTNAVQIKLTSSLENADDARFLFDKSISSWLNRANKCQLISNFEVERTNVFFKIEKSALADLKQQLTSDFYIEIL